MMMCVPDVIPNLDDVQNPFFAFAPRRILSAFWPFFDTRSNGIVLIEIATASLLRKDRAVGYQRNVLEPLKETISLLRQF